MERLRRVEGDDACGREEDEGGVPVLKEGLDVVRFEQEHGASEACIVRCVVVFSYLTYSFGIHQVYM